jgi:hypothetical protein
MPRDVKCAPHNTAREFGAGVSRGTAFNKGESLAQRAVAADLPTSLRQGHDHGRELAEVGAALPDRSR